MPQGTFLLADIGGYTTFLSDVGIEHAKEITSHLLNGMVAVDPDHWKIGNVVGDCLFLYNDSAVDPEETFAQLRGLYESFLDSLTEIAAGSTCRCGACDRSADLALKFVVHSGEFDVQSIAGRVELIGPEIVVAHRLLKNSVPVQEYALFTGPLAKVAKAAGLAGEGGCDTYDDIGAVDYTYVNLRPLRDAYHKTHEFFLTESDADVIASIDIEAPPELVWEIATDAERAPQWAPTLVRVDTLSGGGVEDVGSIHTCLHGDNVEMVHLRVAFDTAGRRATDRLWNVPFVGEMYQTWEVEPVGTGSRFSFYYALRPGVPIVEGVEKSDFVDGLRQHALADVDGLKAMCEAEAGSSSD